MGLVAGGIAAMLQENLALVVALGEFALQETFLLLGGNILYQALLGLEIKGHSITLIVVRSH